MKDKAHLDPFEIDSHTRFLGIEEPDGAIQFYSYVSLRSFRFEELSGREKLQRLKLHFEVGTIEVVGQKLDLLVPAIASESVRVLRPGNTKDPEQPTINFLNFKAAETG
jgi:hypothetical protein